MSRAVLPLRLLDRKNLVGSHIVQHLMDPAWPADFDIFDLLITRKAEMHPRVTRRRVAYRGRGFIPLLPPIFRCDVNLGSETHAIAFATDKLQQDPVVPGIRNIAKKLDRSVEHRHHSIDASIIEQIPKRNPAMCSLKLEIRSRRSADIHEFPIPQVSEK